MDRKNRGLVEIMERQLQPLGEFGSIRGFPHNRLDEVPMGRSTPRAVKRVDYHLADPTAELGCGKVSVSGDQYFFDGDAVLSDESQHDRRDRRRLPRAGAGFDYGESVFQRREGGAEFPFHVRLRPEKIGVKTRPLIFSHWPSRGSSTRRNASPM